ncbi:MlaD family protein [Mangrovimonas aestuarii]|uniref:MlaD family protein n=1 Tax=Mangrovimonas aestuarii TaxID=3018443 RepID=UPI0023788C92|nr:MlaD family protein [Mangrovimonas aestuarii]
MVKSKSENIRLGVLVILGTALLIFAAYLIGNNQAMFNRTITIHAIFNNVNGLQEGNNVRFSGINVGTVKDITMENDTTIRVIMSIKETIQPHIKKDAVATIGSDGLVGNMLVNISPGKGNELAVKNGDQIISYTRIGTKELINTLSVTNENAALLTANLLKVSRSLTHGEGTFGRLLNDTIMASNLEQTILNLKSISIETNRTLHLLNEKINAINMENSVAGVLLKDSIAAAKIQKIINNLDYSSMQIDSTINTLNETVKTFKEGKGAVNYLMTDTTLVKQLETTIKNIEEGTDKFNQNMEALKHNFLFKGYFKKLEKEERKEEKKQQKKS